MVLCGRSDKEGKNMKATSFAIALLALTLSANAQQLAELTAPDPSAGASILLVSQGAALGAPQANQATGAVYLYKIPQGGWQNMPQPSATLTAEDGAPGDEFGAAIVTAGSQLLISAPGHNAGAGAVYVYVNLKLTQEITGDYEPGCGLGASLSTSMSDPKWFMAASPNCYFNGIGWGFATLYQFTGGQWQLYQQFTPQHTGTLSTVAFGYGDKLGYLTVAMGIPYPGGVGTVVIGGLGEGGGVRGQAWDFGAAISMQQSSNLLFVGEPSTATVYVFYGPNREGHPDWGNPPLVGKLTDSALGPNSGFGSSLSARGKQLLIGAPGAGVVDLFTQPVKMWASSDTPAASYSGIGGGTVAWYVGKAPAFIAGEPGAGTGFVVRP